MASIINPLTGQPSSFPKADGDAPKRNMQSQGGCGCQCQCNCKGSSGSDKDSGQTLLSQENRPILFGFFCLAGVVLVCLLTAGVHKVAGRKPDDPSILARQRDYVLRHTDVDEVKESGGFIGRFFCRGNQRSSMCD